MSKKAKKDLKDLGDRLRSRLQQPSGAEVVEEDADQGEEDTDFYDGDDDTTYFIRFRVKVGEVEIDIEATALEIEEMIERAERLVGALSKKMVPN